MDAFRPYVDNADSASVQADDMPSNQDEETNTTGAENPVDALSDVARAYKNTRDHIRAQDTAWTPWTQTATPTVDIGMFAMMVAVSKSPGCIQAVKHALSMARLHNDSGVSRIVAHLSWGSDAALHPLPHSALGDERKSGEGVGGGDSDADVEEAPGCIQKYPDLVQAWRENTVFELRQTDGDCDVSVHMRDLMRWDATHFEHFGIDYTSVLNAPALKGRLHVLSLTAMEWTNTMGAPMEAVRDIFRMSQRL